MKTMIIREFGNYKIEDGYTFDLAEYPVKNCTGCWSCWWRTPGRCMHKDLDECYREILKADKVIIFSKISMGFISGNMKTLLDRLIPLFLPYIKYDTGESMHLPRYEKYPEVEVYYDGEFISREEEELYRDYLERTFYQFHMKLRAVESADKYSMNRYKEVC